MAWITSATNGNVFEVIDEPLVKYLEAEGHKVSASDPRLAKPKTAKS